MCVPALFPPPSRFVSAQQILLTGFLEHGSAEQCFERGRDAVWQRGVRLDSGLGGWHTATVQRLQRVSHVWG